MLPCVVFTTLSIMHTLGMGMVLGHDREMRAAQEWENAGCMPAAPRLRGQGASNHLWVPFAGQTPATKEYNSRAGAVLGDLIYQRLAASSVVTQPLVVIWGGCTQGMGNRLCHLPCRHWGCHQPGAVLRVASQQQAARLCGPLSLACGFTSHRTTRELVINEHTQLCLKSLT